MNIIIISIVYTIGITMMYLLFKNNSNIPSRYIIPILVTLQIKYVFGDWDKGYSYTSLDILYWGCLLALSYLTVHVGETYLLHTKLFKYIQTNLTI